MIDDATLIEVDDGLALNVRTWGTPPVGMLLVHGFGHGGFVWRSLAAAMPDQGIVAVDLRGHGNSDHDRRQRYTIENHVADVVSVARSLDLDDYVLVGHSLGAAVSLLARERMSRAPRAVVLVDGGPGMSPSASSHIRDEFLQQKLRYGSPAEYRDDLQASMPLAESGVLSTMAADALEALGPREYRLRADRGLGYQVQDDAIDAALWEAIERIDVPLLVIRGAASSLCSKRWSDQMALRAPHVVLETVERAGHAVMLDNPARFNALVKRYVSEWLGHREASPFHADQRIERCSGTR